MIYDVLQWIIRVCCASTVTVLKSEDLSYAPCKTLHNIYSQAIESHISRFVNLKITAA